jgi:hypothetical protein
MEERLIEEIARGLRRMPAAKRIAEVKEFMGRSAAHRELIEGAFPDLYREATSAIPRPSAVCSPQLARRRMK